MSISIEAIYEAGVLKPLSPLPDLKEQEKVRLTLEPVSRIAAQRQNRLQVDPQVAREIGDSHEYDSLEG
ncbi:MAG: antitoxin family protein [Pyrinomonadaceae bacterium]